MGQPIIGANIKRARKAAGVATQTELAKRLNVPQPQLSDWENDRYDTPDLKTLLRISAAIPCSLDALVQGVDAQYDAARDLIRHVSEEHSGPGGSDVSASTAARVLELEARERELLALVGAATDASRVLAAVLAAIPEPVVAKATAARKRKPGSRRAAR